MWDPKIKHSSFEYAAPYRLLGHSFNSITVYEH